MGICTRQGLSVQQLDNKGNQFDPDIFGNKLTKHFQMDRKRAIPNNSIYLVSFVSGVLCLINLGSALAFNIIVSLSLLSLLSTYSISIGCILYKRIRGEPLPPARWSLGKWGTWINGIAFGYSCFAIIFCSFPVVLPVDAATANYGPALWALVVVFAVILYIFHGRIHYTPPVMFVEGRRSAGQALQHI